MQTLSTSRMQFVQLRLGFDGLDAKMTPRFSVDSIDVHLSLCSHTHTNTVVLNYYSSEFSTTPQGNKREWRCNSTYY